MAAKILLVTESTDNMAKLEMSLSPYGHEVIPVADLPSAYHMLENDSTIDLVLCDLNARTGDSFEFLKQIRADHVRADMPFIFIVDEQHLLTDNIYKAAAIHGTDKFIFMDEFHPHKVRCAIEAELPPQLSSLPPPGDRDAGLQTGL